MKTKINPLIIGVIIVAAVFLIGKGGFNFGNQAIAGVGAVARTISPTNPYVGETVTVTLNYNGGDKAVTMHDESPFTIIQTGTNIYEAGYVSQGTLTAKSDVYTFVANSAGAKSVTGKYSLNGGADQVIGGTSSFSVTACTSSAEVCNNLDDNCNHQIDEGLTQACYTGPTGTQNIGVCKGGTQTCTTGVWSGCTGQVIPTTEICGDGIDQDCNGADLARNTKADTDCNQAINWNEINAAISSWLSGAYTWTEINQMIAVWLG